MPALIRSLTRVYRDAFSGLGRETWWLAIVLFVNRAGTMVMPFLSLYFTRHLSFSVSEAGWLVGVFGLGSIAGSFLGGWLSDRIDPLVVQRGALVGSGLTFLAVIPLRDPVALGAVMFLSGLVGDTFRPALMVAVSRSSSPQGRARAFALARLAANAGMAVGPAVGGWLAAVNYPLLFVGDALTCWAAAIVLWWKLPELPPAHESEATPEHRLRRSPWRDGEFLLFLAAVLFVALSFFQVFTLLPIHLRDWYAMKESSIGLVIGLNAALIVVFEMILLRRIEGIAPLRVAAWGALFVGGGLVLIPVGPPVWIALVSTVIWTIGEMLTLPMTTVVVSQRANAASQGSYMGAYMVTFSIGLVLAPVLGSRLYEFVSPVAVWLAAGAAGLLAALAFTALGPRMHRRAVVPEG